MQASDAALLGKQGPGGVKASLALSSLQLAQEHTQGIFLLLQRGVQSSAIALLRPQIEAAARGAWIWHCAPDDWCVKYAETGDDGRAFRKDSLLNGLCAVGPRFLNFQKIYNTVIKHFHDYTHGGHLQVMARVGMNGAIGYPQNNQTLFFCAVMARFTDFFAKQETASALGDDVLVRHLGEIAVKHHLFDMQNQVRE
ncbi:hypothetical protein KW843_07520 [Acidovorax sp. sif1233]|uniref:DUF6988 family protein n=1 Tax=Acidovorax sp. sif1233 TaxID=2854792 RepID=UPI001C474DE5|nr:hypothetical protein [Acidovorax sp. sif1233]MBV7454315.1 hypothetical protein [Acidovorax sp. sif1233]